LFQSANPIVSDFFEHSFVETSYCKEIETLDWSSSDTRRLLRYGFSFVTQPQMDGMLYKE
jgi:hypothetical protein